MRIETSRALQFTCMQKIRTLKQAHTLLVQFSDREWGASSVLFGPISGRWSPIGSKPCTSCSGSTSGVCKRVMCMCVCTRVCIC